jgi:tagatose 1,6-diphosphate aldolase GatY/KbaY
MPLRSALDLLPRARAAGHAVGAFSIHSPEMVEAVFDAAEAAAAPVILQVGRRAVRNSGVEQCCAWVRERASRSAVPACLHLDHALDFDAVVRGLRAGCTSVMYDGAELPLAENARRTAEIVRLAHAAGVPVEAEVGRVGGVEDDISVEEAEARLAGPEACARFVAETGCDSLAPAVGSVHGLGSGVPRLRIDLLRRIAAVVPLPLVLHGGSGLDGAQMRAAIGAGVAKVNIDTELRRAFVAGLREGLEAHGPTDDPALALAAGTAAVRAQVAARIADFGAAGQA